MKTNKMADEEKAEEKKITVAKNAAELQKIRLEKLMKNPAKPAYIPDPSKDYKPRDPLEFIRNIWGSSAGAGSGDFHVYRGVRRREYARQKFAKEKSEKELADEAYKKKVEENVKEAEELTAKKRAKRLKKKQKFKNKKMKKTEQKKSEESSEEEDESDDSNDKNSAETSCKTSDQSVDKSVDIVCNKETFENGGDDSVQCETASRQDVQR